MRVPLILLLINLLSSCGMQKIIPLKDKINKTEMFRIMAGMNEKYMNDNDPGFFLVKDFMSNQEPQWGQTLGTFPSPQLTVAFLDSSENLLFPLWIGPNWIGTRYENESYLKNIPENEIDSLKTMLGH